LVKMSVCACVCERESERDVFFVRACACVCVACACSNYYRITESTCIHVRTLTVSQPATYLRSHSGRVQPLPKHPHTHAHIHVRTNNEQPRTITYTYTHTHVHTHTHAKIYKQIRTTTHTHPESTCTHTFIHQLTICLRIYGTHLPRPPDNTPHSCRCSSMSLIRARFTGDGLAAVLRPAPPLPAFAISPFSVLVRFVPAYEYVNP